MSMANAVEQYTRHSLVLLRRMKLFITGRSPLAADRNLPGADPESPEDPYAYVGAPVKPRTPYLRGAAAVDLPE